MIKLKKITDEDFEKEASPMKTITIKNGEDTFHGRIYGSLDEIPNSVREAMNIYEYTEDDTTMYFASLFPIDQSKEWYAYHGFREVDDFLDECKAAFTNEVNKLHSAYSDLFRGSEYSVSVSACIITEEKPHVKID